MRQHLAGVQCFTVYGETEQSDIWIYFTNTLTSEVLLFLLTMHLVSYLQFLCAIVASLLYSVNHLQATAAVICCCTNKTSFKLNICCHTSSSVLYLINVCEDVLSIIKLLIEEKCIFFITKLRWELLQGWTMNDITSSWWGHLRVQYCIWWTDVKMWVSINLKVFEVKTVIPLISDVHIYHKDTSLCCLLKVIRADSTVSKQSRWHVTVAVIFSALYSRKDTRVLPCTDWKLWFKCLWGLVSSDSFGLTSRSPCEASLKLRESPLQTLAPPSPLHWPGRRLMTLCLSSNRLSDNRPGSPSLLPPAMFPRSEDAV